MSNSNHSESPAAYLDRSDTRVEHAVGLLGWFKEFIDRVRSGDVGSLPVVVGLIIIWTVFASLNPIFLSSNNIVNLLYDCSTIGVIALGIVCVLMLGEIDLSVGSMSGVGSAMLGVLWVNQELPLSIVIMCAIAAGGIVGFTYAFLRIRLGMPSFVSTLAGLLALLGFQLYILGTSGSINLPYGSALVNFGQLMIMPAWLAHSVLMLPGIALLGFGLRHQKRRKQANLSSGSVAGLLFRVAAMTVALQTVAVYLYLGRGLPWMFALFVCLVLAMDYALTRTKWGRSMRAVGGNAEAARRAGINVDQIYISAFVACSMFAALGGILSASRLASASTQAGTGDVNLNAIAAAVIGGTSLFGGRGSAYSALLGIIVIASIANGLTLLNMSSSLRYMITGAVLAIAVIADSLARRSRVTHGRA
jgi:D-xylose transport system permease protein